MKKLMAEACLPYIPSSDIAANTHRSESVVWTTKSSSDTLYFSYRAKHMTVACLGGNFKPDNYNWLNANRSLLYVVSGIGVAAGINVDQGYTINVIFIDDSMGARIHSVAGPRQVNEFNITFQVTAFF